LEGQSVPGWQEGLARMVPLDSLLLVPTRKSLVALDPVTGKIRWRAAREFRDQATWVDAEQSGVLVGGLGRLKPFLTLLNPRDGSQIWAKPLAPKPGAIGYHLGDTLYLSDDGRFSAIPLSSGIPQQLATVEFKGGEQPATIDTAEGGGFILSARQNIARVGTDGRYAYRLFYQAPGASLLAKIVSTAFVVAVNAAAYAAAPAGTLVPLMDNPLLSVRYGRASLAKNYYYIYTSSPDAQGQKGFSLVQVDRRDGREAGRMWFEQRSPDYSLDEISGYVYLLEGETGVVARRFR
jgi:hypothetical protein